MVTLITWGVGAAEGAIEIVADSGTVGGSDEFSFAISFEDIQTLA
jgi:hypothetical protein